MHLACYTSKKDLKSIEIAVFALPSSSPRLSSHYDPFPPSAPHPAIASFQQPLLASLLRIAVKTQQLHHALSAGCKALT